MRTDNDAQLLVETEFHAGYSLLEPPFSQGRNRVIRGSYEGYYPTVW